MIRVFGLTPHNLRPAPDRKVTFFYPWGHRLGNGNLIFWLFWFIALFRCRTARIGMARPAVPRQTAWAEGSP